MKTKHQQNLLAAALVGALAFTTAFARADEPITPETARVITKDAFVYGYPMVDNYKTLYKQAVDRGGPDYRAPFNEISSAKNIATPADTWVVTPNSDTPYSFLWMDLRAEPLVITMPKIEKGRYYSAQLIDLYTYNFAYLGTRAYGNGGGDFLIAGPGWKGAKPKGIKAVIHCDTEIAYTLFRTQFLIPAICRTSGKSSPVTRCSH